MDDPPPQARVEQRGKHAATPGECLQEATSSDPSVLSVLFSSSERRLEGGDAVPLTAPFPL